MVSEVFELETFLKKVDCDNKPVHRQRAKRSQLLLCKMGKFFSSLFSSFLNESWLNIMLR